MMSPSGTTDDLDYMHARHYNLNLGRFLSPDPAPADPHNPSSWNAYAYVLNNPVNFVDPWGLKATPCYQDSVAGDQPCFQEEIKVKARAPLSFNLGLDSFFMGIHSAGESFEGFLSDALSPKRSTNFLGLSATGGFGPAGQVEGGVYWNSSDWGFYGLYGFGAGFGSAVGPTGGQVQGGANNVAGEYVEGQLGTIWIGGSIFFDGSDTSSWLPPRTGWALAPPGEEVGGFVTWNHAARISIPDTSRRVESFMLRAMQTFCDSRAWGF